MSIRTIDTSAWTLERALDAKGDHSISVCIPCRNEVATVGPIVRTVVESLMGRVGLVDELVVLDDGSVDGSDRVARDAGARVVPVAEPHRRFGVGRGKGNALWTSLASSTGSLVVWCDGDVANFEPSWVVRLVAPLLLEREIGLVKAAYHRPEDQGGGGRTTELVARPLLSLFAPELSALDQPLSGEMAGRREVLEAVPFVEGWGVEIGLLLDIAGRWGPRAIAQVDLGVRLHRHRSLNELSVQAAEVLATFLARLPEAGAMATPPALHRADGSMVLLNLAERPPLAEMRAAR